MKNLGQLFICGISSLTLTESEKNFIQNENIGGVILFSHNYQDPAQLAELVNEIQSLRDEYPLFISVDQEGGRVQRFKNNFTHFPSMYDVAKLDSPKITFEVHSAIAQELSACGINLNFSPVCDIWTNQNNKVIGDRSFGKSGEIVEKHVSAAIRGLQTHNVLACGKHFPGHGDTTKDSHYDLPYLKTSLDQLRSRELIPFQKASKARVEFMMMAHLVVDAIDEQMPTSLSAKAYQFLREELKYKNIIVTDDMEMKAISDRFKYGEAAVMALEAGADMLIYRTSESCQEAYFATKQALVSKRISREELDRKANLINSVKKNYFNNYKPIYIPNIKKAMNLDNNQKLLIEINVKLDQLALNS